MFGLVVIAALLVYLLVLIRVTGACYRFAKRAGKSKWECRAWGLFGFLLIYVPVFWDHVPTLVTWQYSCLTEAGFWEYKSIEQWKIENPGEASRLVSKRVSPSETVSDGDRYITTYSLNQRFAWVTKREGQLPVNRWRHEWLLVDRGKNGEVLARSIDFSSSQISPRAGWAGWKFWLNVTACPGGTAYTSSFRNVRDVAADLGQREE